jgi:hypothetical protein
METWLKVTFKTQLSGSMEKKEQRFVESDITLLPGCKTCEGLRGMAEGGREKRGWSE